MHDSIELEIRRPQVSEPHRLVFEQPYVIIGRADVCDLQLPHPAVSPRHAYLQRVNGRVMCVDLGSQSGTRWNNYAKHRDWIGRGDRVSIGPYDLGLAAGDERPDGDGSAAERLSPPHPRVLLKVLRPTPRTSQQLLWPLRHCVNVIGRGRNCNIRVEHESISPAHCSVVIAADGVWFLDLMSEEGTLINGQRVRYARLHSGNELQIGGVLFRIMFGGQAAEPGGNGNGRARRNGATRPAAPVILNGHPASGSGASPTRTVRDERSEAGEAAAEPTPEPSPGQRPESEPAAEMPQHESAPYQGDITLFPRPQRHFSEEFVLSLMNQFAAMQMQQMTLMSEIFMGMQQRYLDFIRDDLSRVQELTTELQTLQAQLMQRHLSFAALPATDPAEASAASPTATEVHSEVEETASDEPHGDAPVSPAAEESAATQATDGAADAVEDGEAARPEPEPQASPEPERSRRDDQRPAMDPDEQYEWLLQRINQVERERNSRWKSILQALSGAKGDRG